MTKQFLKYWLYSTVEDELSSADPLLDFSASDQYNRVNPEDTIWYVTCPPRSVQLFLFGRMHVGWTGSREDAARLLGVSADDLWEASYTVMPYPHEAEPYDFIEITGIADDLRFVSPTGKDRLPAKNRAQALQAMRVLTPETTEFLRDIWFEGKDVPGADNAASQEDLSLRGFVEGRKKLQEHFRRERNPRLVAEAKRAFKQAHGRLYCEVCGFDFSQSYRRTR